VVVTEKLRDGSEEMAEDSFSHLTFSKVVLSVRITVTRASEAG
jgi:hypothetical protein